jgi:hypothetical protein
MRCFEKPVLDDGDILDLGTKPVIYSWITQIHFDQTEIFDITRPILDRARIIRHRRNVLLLTRQVSLIGATHSRYLLLR